MEIKQGYYRHFKGNYYYLMEVANHSETMEPMVVYRALYGERKLWVRPASMWNEIVDKPEYHGPRFVAVDATEVPIESVCIADSNPDIREQLSEIAIRNIFGDDAPVSIIKQYIEFAAYGMPKQSSSKNALNYIQLCYVLWAMVDLGLLCKRYCGMRREMTEMLATILEPEDAANNHLLEYFCSRERPKTNAAQKAIEDYTRLIQFTLEIQKARKSAMENPAK